MKSKMKIFYSTLLGLLVLLASSSSFAANIAMEHTVEEVYNYDSYFVVKLTPAFTNDLNCGGGGAATRYVAILSSQSSNWKMLYASILTAMSLDKQVGFGVNTCVDWGGGIPAAYRVDMK